MTKKEIGAHNYLYPMPTVLVGATVEGRPNYLTAAFCGMLNVAPPLLGLGLNRKHFTNRGIQANGTFSVNIPSESQVAVTDYCGLVSGRDQDKSALFASFYGKLGTAPMITECPLTMECRLRQSLDLGGPDEIFIGEIIATYCEESCLSRGLPDIRRIRPIIFSFGENSYWKLGDRLGPAWSLGKNYQAPVR
jgi:flavin reductase (DIM6/NTAB) family NADH-FMN oxidoreductase RutF